MTIACVNSSFERDDSVETTTGPDGSIRKTYKIAATEPDGSQCSICQNEVRDWRQHIRLPCGHCFDAKCLFAWAETCVRTNGNGSEIPCPNCRADSRLDVELVSNAPLDGVPHPDEGVRRVLVAVMDVHANYHVVLVMCVNDDGAVSVFRRCTDFENLYAVSQCVWWVPTGPNAHIAPWRRPRNNAGMRIVSRWAHRDGRWRRFSAFAFVPSPPTTALTP